MTQSNNNTSSELRDAVMHDEDLIAAVRGHLYIEIQLNRLIERLVPYPEEIENSKLGWQQRVELALGLGLKSQYGPPLKKLGNIRNKFAHRPDASIEDKDITELSSASTEKTKRLCWSRSGTHNAKSMIQ